MKKNRLIWMLIFLFFVTIEFAQASTRCFKWFGPAKSQSVEYIESKRAFALESLGLRDVRPDYVRAGANLSGIPDYQFNSETGVLSAYVYGIDNAPYGLDRMWRAATHEFRKVVPIPEDQGRGFMVWYDVKQSLYRELAIGFFQTEVSAIKFIESLP